MAEKITVEAPEIGDLFYDLWNKRRFAGFSEEMVDEMIESANTKAYAQQYCDKP